MIDIDLLVLERKKTSCVFLRFCYYLPLGKGVGFHLNTLKPPSPKADFAKSG
jgi:hypothetical protein